MFYLSLSLIVFVGAILYLIAKKINIPQLVLYLIWGIILGYFSLLDSSLLNISSQIRKIALIIILAKAGLSLNLNDLKKNGISSILMSFLPAVTEMVTVGLVAPLFLDISYVESFLLGSVLGAVSPAVVIPMMSKLIDKNYGTKKGIPQLIIAGSSIDDIIMIVFFQAFLTIEKGNDFSFLIFLNIPISIVLGILAGILIGLLLSLILKFLTIDDNLLFIIILSLGFLLTYVEGILEPYVSFSSLLAIITMGIVIRIKHKQTAKKMTDKCSKVWIVAEMFLFTLVGASIKITYAIKYLGWAILVLLISLTMRSLAVNLSILKTKFNVKERIFTTISYLPKATVQAAIGGVLFDYANSLQVVNQSILNAGEIVLSVSVLAILITAPISAILMNFLYPKLLSDDSLN